MYEAFKENSDGEQDLASTVMEHVGEKMDMKKGRGRKSENNAIYMNKRMVMIGDRESHVHFTNSMTL